MTDPNNALAKGVAVGRGEGDVMGGGGESWCVGLDISQVMIGQQFFFCHSNFNTVLRLS